VLFYLAHEWAWRRDVLSVLGAENPGRVDELLVDDTPDTGPVAQSAAERMARAREMGGEVLVG